MERGGDEITEHDEITRKYSIFNKTVCLLLVFFFSTTDTARFFEEMNQDIRIKTSFSS